MITWLGNRQGGWVRLGKVLLFYKHWTNDPLWSERSGAKKFRRVGFGYRVCLKWDEGHE